MSASRPAADTKPVARLDRAGDMRPLRRWLLPAGVGVLALLIGGLIYSRLLLPRGPLGWDESVHALKGLVIAHDLAHGDGLSFLFNSYRQVLYPPIHSWFLALAYLLSGPSMTTAATVTLILFLLGAGLLYLAGGQLRSGVINWAGAVAALLWLTSPDLAGYAVAVMLEVPGLTALCLALLVQLKLLADAPDPREYMLLGAAIALTYLVRTPYGIILFLTVAIFLVLEVRGRLWLLWNRRVFYLLLPLALVLAVWFAYPPKIAATWGWLVNYPDGVDDPYSAEGWLFYPLALVRIAGSPWLFALYLAAIVYALVERRKGALFLVTLVLVQTIIGEFHQNKQARYMFPVLPAWFLLAGSLLMGLGQRLAARRPTAARWGMALVALLLVAQCALLVRGTLDATFANPPDGITAYVAETVEAVQANGQRTLVIGSMDMSYPSPPLLDWRLMVEHGLLAAPQAGSAAQIEEGRRLAALAARLPLPSSLAASLERVVTAYDRPAALRTLYLGLPIRASYSDPAQAPVFVGDLVQAQTIDQVVVVSAPRPDARFPLSLLAPALEAAGLRHVEGETFADVGIQVDVFRR